MSGRDELAREDQSGLLVPALMAGMGGMLPTLCKTAAQINYTSNTAIILSAGFLVGVTLYFVIGFILSLGLAERRRKEAFINNRDTHVCNPQ